MKRGLAIALIAAFVAAMTAFAKTETSLSPPPVTGSHIEVVRVNGIINAGTARYIMRGIKKAEKTDAAMLVVTLNTPGGLLTSTREIVQAIDQSKIPVMVYVSPSGGSATSAGTIITMSAHVAAMAPGTNIGAAHPVGGQGEKIEGPLNEKAVNDTVAFIRAQAKLRGRNEDWAEQAIRKSVSVTADEAEKEKVVDFTAQTLEGAITAADGRKVSIDGQPRTVKTAGLRIEELPMTAGEKVLTFLGDPNVSYLLMAVGGLAIYAEINTPGAIIPGIVGAICLLLAFISFSTLPVNYGAVALLFLGMLLFVAEVFVTSYGALTVGGIVSLILGALFLLDSSTGDLRLSLALVIPTVLAVAAITGFVGVAMFRIRRNKPKTLGGFEGFTGTVEVIDRDGVSGICLIRGENWNFKLVEGLADSRGPLHIGDHLAVVKQEGLKLFVKRTEG